MRLKGPERERELARAVGHHDVIGRRIIIRSAGTGADQLAQSRGGSPAGRQGSSLARPRRQHFAYASIIPRKGTDEGRDSPRTPEARVGTGAVGAVRRSAGAGGRRRRRLGFVISGG